MCVGIKNDCTDVSTCTYHAYGPCGNKTAPDIYFEGEIVGFALIKDASTYLTSPSENNPQVVNPSQIANNGYRHADKAKTYNNAKYAFITAGAFYGENPAVSGGFLGMASYAMVSGSISTKYNSVLVPSAPGQAADTITESNVCISEVTNGACGADRTFNTGDFKFSMFGYTSGSSFSNPEGTKYYGIRTKMSLKGTSATVTLNDGVALDAIGSTDVTHLELKETAGDQRTLVIEFPLHYNYGDKVAAVDGAVPVLGTKEVKIRVSSAGDGSIYIDYLFDTSELNVADKYFIYDPTVKEKGTAGTATTNAPSTVSGAFRMSMSIPLVVALVASLMRAAA